MASDVKVIDRGRRLIENRLVLLEELRVFAGVQGEEAARKHPKGDATVGEVAKFIQFGVENQPARPYLDFAIESIKLEARDTAQDVAKEVASPVKTPVSEALKPLGEEASQAVREGISRAGAVDTGATRDAVTYTVRRGERVEEKGR